MSEGPFTKASAVGSGLGAAFGILGSLCLILTILQWAGFIGQTFGQRLAHSQAISGLWGELPLHLQPRDAVELPLQRGEVDWSSMRRARLVRVRALLVEEEEREAAGRWRVWKVGRRRLLAAW